MTDLSRYENVFYNMLSVYTWAGDEALWAFEDKPKTEQTSDPHAIVMLRSDRDKLQELEGRKEKDRRAWGASDVLRYIQERTEKHRREGKEPREPVEIGDNLFLIYEDAENLTALKQGNPGLAERLRVICNTNGEYIKWWDEGFRTELKAFDRVDPGIRKEGVITLDDDDLYAEIVSQVTGGKDSIDRRVLEEGFPTNASGEPKIFRNQYVIIHPEGDRTHPIIGWMVGETEYNEQTRRWEMGPLEMRVLASPKGGYDELSKPVLGIHPRDLEQKLYLHALQQPHIGAIFVTGGAGSGKTLLGYASALQQTLKQPSKDSLRESGKPQIPMKNLKSRFRTIYLTKTGDLIGGSKRDIGFMPGDVLAKLEADVQSYVDAHEELDVKATMDELLHGRETEKQRGTAGSGRENGLHVGHGLYLPQSGGVVAVQNYAKWRGRTITRSVAFMDEAQNLSPAEFKHLMQRMGEDSLFIVSGDYMHQRDTSMGATSNGLFMGIRHNIGHVSAAVIDLKKAYRHALAEHAESMRVYG